MCAEVADDGAAAQPGQRGERQGPQAPGDRGGDGDRGEQVARVRRLSNVELARRVGLTPPPCLRRVKRLEEAGVIAGYQAVIDPAAVGRSLEVIVDLEVAATDLKTVEELEATMAGYDEVVELRRMFGRPDYFIRVAVADHAAFEAFLTGRLIGLPGVQRATST